MDYTEDAAPAAVDAQQPSFSLPSMAMNSSLSLSEEPAAGRPDRRRVLVVDDNADLVRLTALLLSNRGFTVETAPDGPMAVKTARFFRPHVVLLDIGLPGMDGYDVAQALRSGVETKDAIIIAVSAYDRQAHHHRSVQAGFDHHLVKPVDLDSLFLLCASARS